MGFFSDSYDLFSLLLLILVRVWHRRRLPSLRHHHVRVLKQEDRRGVHRRRLRHAEFRDSGSRYCQAAALNHYFPAPAYSVDPIGSTVPQADYLWWIVLMFGAVPAALTYYSRAKMPETARYTDLVANDAKKAVADMSKVLNVKITEETAVQGGTSYGLFSREFVVRHALHLVGTAVCWFLLDIAYYSQNLFQKDIFSAVGWIPKANTMNDVEEVYKISAAGKARAIVGAFG